MTFTKATRVMSERDIGYDEARRYFSDLVDRAAAKGLRDETEIKRLRAAMIQALHTLVVGCNPERAAEEIHAALGHQQSTVADK